MEQSESKARAAGRGGIAVLGAKAFFIVSGLAQQLVLPRVIGIGGYGALSRVLVPVNIVNNVVVATSTQGVSRAVARAGAHGKDAEALRATLRVHVVLAIVIALLFAAAAPAVTAFQKAPYILGPLLVVSGVVLCYGLYAPLIGALNGRARFGRQASLDVSFAVMRTVGLLVVGWLFTRRGLPGELGATVGFVAAAVAIVPLAVRWAGTGRAGGTSDVVPAPGAYLSELWPLALAQLFTNLVMQVDIFLLGHFLSVAANAAHADAPARAADEWIAVYRACQLFAFLPYQLLFSVTQVLFPMVARAKAEKDDAAVKAYVMRGARLGAIACGLMVAVLVAIPGSLLHFAFPAPIDVRGAFTLRVLAFGLAAFAMLGIGATVLASLGRERVSALITFVALVLVGGACWVVLPQQAFGEAQLRATAMATALALGSALIATAITVRVYAGGFVPLPTVARVGAALVLAALAGGALPQFGRAATPIVAAGVAIAYVAFLVITRELGAEDVAAVRALVARRAKRS